MKQNETKNKQSKSRFKKVMKRGIIVLSVLFCIMFSFILLMLYSTSVRQYVVSKVIDAANNFLLADISIKDLYFNGINNIIIDDIVIKTGTDTLADIKQINISYKIRSLITNHIQINKIELNEPKIALLRSYKDSLWNYTKIAHPSTDTTTDNDTTTSPMQISINNIIIKNGVFTYWDSLNTSDYAASTDALDADGFLPSALNNKSPYFNSMQMQWNIKSFDANNIIVNPGKNYYAININQLITNENNSYIDVKSFQSNIKLNEEGIFADNSNIILDDTTTISFSAAMSNFNVFGNSDERDIDDAVMSLNMDLQNFNCNFIDNFAVIPIKLGVVNDLNINAKGTLNDMKVSHLNLKINKSNLELNNIHLTNITNSSQLTYAGSINNSNIKISDVQAFFNPSVIANTSSSLRANTKYLRGNLSTSSAMQEDCHASLQDARNDINNKTNINLDAIKNIKNATINQLTFFGTTDSIYANLNIDSDMGGVMGEVALAFSYQGYETTLNLNNINLLCVTNDPALFSKINAQVHIKGNHFDINEMNADIDLTLLPSTFNRHSIDTSHISLTYIANDKATINDCKIVLHNRRSNANIIISGGANIKDMNNPKTDLFISLQNLRPYYMLRDSALPRLFSGDIKLKSIGKDLNNLIANANIDVKEISFDNKSLFPFNIDIACVLQENNAKIQIDSSFNRDIFSLNQADSSLNRDIFSLNQADSSFNRDIFSFNQIDSSLNRDIFSLNQTDFSLIRDIFLKKTSDFLNFTENSSDFLNFSNGTNTNKNEQNRANFNKNEENFNKNEQNFIYISANNDYENIFDVLINGNFNLEDAIYYLQRDADLLANYFGDKINDGEEVDSTLSVLPNISSSLRANTKYLQSNLPTLSTQEDCHASLQDARNDGNDVVMNINVRTKNLGYVYFKDDDFVINKSDVYARLNYAAKNNKSEIKIDSLFIHRLDINFDSNNVILDSLYINSKIDLLNTGEDILNDLSANISSNHLQSYNNIKIYNIETQIRRSENKISFNVGGNFNDIVDGSFLGHITTNEKGFSLLLDSLMIGVNGYNFYNDTTVSIGYRNERFRIRRFGLTNANNERIEVRGRFDKDRIDSMKVKFSNINTNNNVAKVLNSFGIENSFGGYVDSIYIIVNGEFVNPSIVSNIFIEDFNYDNYGVGNLNANFNYSNKNVSASTTIVQRGKELLSINVKDFPISLSLDSTLGLIDSTKELDVAITINDLPTQIIEPFIPSIDNLSGLINGGINVSGYYPNDFNYAGEVNLNNIKMRVAPINMYYVANGKVNAGTGLISFDKLKIKNIGADISNGEVILDGRIKLDGFALDSFDILASANQFQVLSDNTQSAMPFFYGKMIIATAESPLRINGTLNEPNLTGSVNIINADVKMPDVLANQVIKRETKFNYINKEDIIKIESVNNSAVLADNNDAVQNNFVDLLNIDLNVRINKFAIALELGIIGNVFARVGTKEPNAQLNYKKLRTSDEAKIYGGELEILDGSTLQYIKTMSAKGTISFPTARISQPRLDLSAEYKGKTSSDYPINYSVFVNVTGTPQNPLIDLNYSINGDMVMGDKQQIQVDAFNALTRGVIKGYNDASGSNLLGENNLASLFASQIASKQLTDMLLKTGVIQSVNLKFDDNDFNSANVSFSGLIGNYATWTIGGKIEDIASNYNFSFDVPFYINGKLVNNILFQASKSTAVNSAAFDKNAKDWEVSLKFHGKW